MSCRLLQVICGAFSPGALRSLDGCFHHYATGKTKTTMHVKGQLIHCYTNRLSLKFEGLNTADSFMMKKIASINQPSKPSINKFYGVRRKRECG